MFQRIEQATVEADPAGARFSPRFGDVYASRAGGIKGGGTLWRVDPQTLASARRTRSSRTIGRST